MTANKPVAAAYQFRPGAVPACTPFIQVARRRLQASLRPAVIAILISLAAGCSGDRDDTGVTEQVIRDNTLGTAYLGQQEWELAAATFVKALTLEPGEPLLLNNLAVAFIQMGDPEAAEARLQEALDADPGYPYANYNLGLIQANRGDFKAAAAQFQAVAEVDPNDPLTQYNLGVAYSGLGENAQAEISLRRALEIDPEHVSSLYALGRQLVSQGEREEGGDLIARSQSIRARSGLDVAVGSQYGEQGPYAMGVEYPGNALRAPGAVKVTYASRSNLPLDTADAATLALVAPDQDPLWVVADGGTLRSIGGARDAEEGRTLAEVTGKIHAISAGDGNSDGTVELYAVISSGPSSGLLILDQQEDGTFASSRAEPIGAEIELPGKMSTATITLVDRDHDGDLDVFWCWLAQTGSGCAISTNDGLGEFATRSSEDHGFQPDLGAATALRSGLSDIDNDRDIDLLLGTSDSIYVMLNRRDGMFDAIAYPLGAKAKLADMSVVDIDKDAWMEILVGGPNGLHLIRNLRGELEPPVLLAGRDEPVDALVTLDADNDGFIDIAVSGNGSLQAFRNLGGDEWESTAWLDTKSRARFLGAVDADADGDIDLASAGDDGAFQLINEGGNANHWISVESMGVGDNAFGIGSKVEVMSGALRQKFEITSVLPLHMGLGARDHVDSVRYLWPSGVLQDEIRQPAGRAAAVTQLDRKGTSCPLLYVMQDGNWRYVTDFLGGSAIGYQHAPGIFSTPDTDEYILLEHAPTADVDGNLKIRVNNQLQEIIWFDKVELVAVDHPAGTEVYPNERLMPGPPWPKYQLFVSGNIREVSDARSIDDSSDLRPALAARDRRYVNNFELLPFKGYARDHTIELDLGDFSHDERVVLLLDGWIDYADSSANVAAHQAGVQLTPPVLTVSDGRGNWQETGHLMGFPAGLPKTMSVDVSGLFESGDHRVRIATNMRIYWDRARVMIGGDELPVEQTRLAVVDAELGYGGFPDETSSDGRRPYAYDPESLSSESPWKAHVGRYTEFGDVTDFLTHIDDRMITTRAGDEIELTFRSPQPIPDGHVRTYLFFADGFGKDMDPNSAANNHVGPMPFHGMPTYPYPDNVVPPMMPERLGRIVTESDRGLPGAVPQALVSRPAKPSVVLKR